MCAVDGRLLTNFAIICFSEWLQWTIKQPSPTTQRARTTNTINLNSHSRKSVKWNWRQRKVPKKKMFTICCPRKVKMIFTKRQSLVILKAAVFVFVLSLYFLVLIKESKNVMENNAKSKTVTASKVDNVSISSGLDERVWGRKIIHVVGRGGKFLGFNNSG